MSFVTGFKIPISFAGVGMKDFFPNFLGDIKADDLFEKFIGGAITYDVRKVFLCDVNREIGATFSELLGDSAPLSLDQVCAILAHLGNDGSWLLKIPPKSEEINILIGFIEIEGKRHVLYLEHELEEGKNEEIHLHVREDKEENEPVLVLKVV